MLSHKQHQPDIDRLIYCILYRFFVAKIKLDRQTFATPTSSLAVACIVPSSFECVSTDLAATTTLAPFCALLLCRRHGLSL
jgi:hypothetical protein